MICFQSQVKVEEQFNKTRKENETNHINNLKE